MRDYLEARHVLAVSSGTAALAPVAPRARGRAGRRGDHELDHLAGDRERDRPLRRDAGLRRCPRGHLNIDPERVRDARRPSARKAIVPVDLYGQPCGSRPAARARPAASSRTRRTPPSRATAAARSAAIADLTCFSLYATKNIAAGEGGLIATNRDDLAAALDDLRVMRRGHGSLYDIAVPGYKANLCDVLASIALVQLDKVDRHARDPQPAGRDLRRGVADLDGRRAGRARSARRACQPPLRRARDPSPGATATSSSARSPTRTSGRRSTSCRCTG